MSEQDADREPTGEITLAAYRVDATGTTEIVPPKRVSVGTQVFPSTMRWPPCRCPKCREES